MTFQFHFIIVQLNYVDQFYILYGFVVGELQKKRVYHELEPVII